MTTHRTSLGIFLLFVIVAYGAYLKNPRKITIEFKQPELAKEIIEAEKRRGLYQEWLHTPTRIQFKLWYKTKKQKLKEKDFIKSL